jgi:hypothetical protein
MVGWGFDEANYRNRILTWSDAEIIKAGKAASPAGSRWSDPATIEENVIKYRILREEWRRRHPHKEA